MRPADHSFVPVDHAGITGISADQHHDEPENIEFSNTTLVVEPLPGGPGVLEVVIPDNATYVRFYLRSVHTSAEGAGKAGAIGVCSSNSLRTSCFCTGGHGTLATSSYNMVYTKVSAAINLTDKVFDSAGADISLTEAYIKDSGADRVLRLEWTNYSAGFRTLNVWGEIGVLG